MMDDERKKRGRRVPSVRKKDVEARLLAEAGKSVGS